MRLLRRILKDAFFAFHRTELGSRASILSYHNIGNDGAFFTVSKSELERQLKYIKEHNVCIVRLSELARRLQGGKDISGCVALTFNDGYKSFYTELFPLLKKYEIPATIFITAEVLDTSIKTSDGHTFQTLSLAEVREMLGSGLVEFMPQAQHRTALHEVPFEHAVDRIQNARRDVEGITQKEARVFAYSKGRPTEQLAKHMREHNWLGAVTGYEGLVHPNIDPFFLPRNAVDSRTTFTQFKGKVSGAIEEYVELRKK